MATQIRSSSTEPELESCGMAQEINRNQVELLVMSAVDIGRLVAMTLATTIPPPSENAKNRQGQVAQFDLR